MKTMFYSFAIVLLWVMPGCDQPQIDLARKEQTRLQGTWRLVKISIPDNEIPVGVYGDYRLIVRDDTIEFGDRKYRFTVGPSNKPRTIDLQCIGGSGKEETIDCIYGLEGDNWKLAWPKTGAKRPTTLDSNSDVVLYSLKPWGVHRR